MRQRIRSRLHIASPLSRTIQVSPRLPCRTTNAHTPLDKVADKDKPKAHAKFQEIAFAYAILSDTRRRARYDATGRTEETLTLGDDEDGDFNWTEYYRTQFAEVVTTEAIEQFRQEYKGSDEERQAVLDAYDQTKGSMSKLYELVMLSDPLEDEDRFRAIIDAAINNGDMIKYKKYADETPAQRKRRIDKARKEAGKEALEAQEMAEELGVADKLFGKDKAKSKGKGSKKGKEEEDHSALAALIQQRQKGRSQNFLADLEAKYAPKGKKSKRKTPEDEPPEEAFERTAEKAKKGKVGSSKAAPENRRSKRVKAEA